MRKSLLLMAAGGLSLSAQAQLKQASSIVEVAPRQMVGHQPLPMDHVGTPVDGPNKAAGLKTRYYNYVDHLEQVSPGVLVAAHNNLPYMWNSFDAYGMYTSGRDTINMPSFGAVLHPQWNGYNTTSNGYAKGTMVVSSDKAYTVDSIWFSGYYGRPNTGTFKDTIRIAYSYGRGTNTNIPTYVWYDGTGTPFIKPHYGVDSLFSAALAFDLVKHTMYKPATSTGPAISVKDIVLSATDTGSHTWGIAANLAVPAPATAGGNGNLVGMTVTFISGAPYTPYDTVFRGNTINPQEPFKYGMLRPYVYVENGTAASPGWANYTPGNYNSGQYEVLPEPNPQTNSTYSPNWVWSTDNGVNASGLQFPYVDWKISCPTCGAVTVENISSYITTGELYPNPAASTVTMPITVSEAVNITATLTDVMGQTVASQNIGQVVAHQSKNISFNTADLAAGIYLLTIKANGEQIAKRFTVMH
jgi:hypothetical protein